MSSLILLAILKMVEQIIQAYESCFALHHSNILLSSLVARECQKWQEDILLCSFCQGEMHLYKWWLHLMKILRLGLSQDLYLE